MQDMIRLSEDFVLLDALDQKWSKEIRHKCTCSAFFKDAQTEHAAAAALSMFLFPAEVSVPADSDIRVVNQRRRLKRRRVAADVDDDGKDEPRKKPANLHGRYARNQN